MGANARIDGCKPVMARRVLATSSGAGGCNGGPDAPGHDDWIEPNHHD
jgi:hypothetical protein